ncbi:B-cell antigen receptor complex-associated protein beta chain isoform X2 [Centropristis striata]|uniref:B-cell antigen receptor complex-associated protein beta chain isoform X2 n=1 Tax=Centropristis striata TaxID=184440 RepID=UPI0027E00D07|nr:B-cell antigen receptor complex-associated protein beta chain isoform X2 [Centropristis striata]
MRWLLAGYCGLTLINISVALNIIINQKPRFLGVNPRYKMMTIQCLQSELTEQYSTQWYKAVGVDGENKTVQGPRFFFQNLKKNKNAALTITDARMEDSGVYFCKVNGTWGPGTAVQIAKAIDVAQAEYRSKMKDGLIVLQGLVLAGCIAAVLLRKQTLREKKDSIYEEPETDHIYEGLAIETCGGGLYEELSVYAQAEGAEAPWE